MSGSRRAARRAAVLCCAAAGASLSGRAAAQGATVVAAGRPDSWSDVAVGSEEENYLRVLQLVGAARPRPWSLRPFGPGELRGLVADSADHPWRARARFDNRAASARWTGAAAGVAYNSGFPLSFNDGAIWAGRGATAYARGGVAARWRWFSARLEPVAFWALNQRVGIVANRGAGALRFGDALAPYYIDAPQRFGDRPYARLDPGQSTVRVDAVGLAVGVTTANQWWGPALVDPLVLGTNAAGHPRAFAGTSRPVSFGLGTVHAVAQTGRLTPSGYAELPRDSTYRLGLGVAVVATVRGVPGLELGGTRFFHERWRGAGRAPGRISTAFQSLYGFSGAEPSVQNQLGSVFGRWVFAGAGAEVYAEYLRNDASLDARDFALEPDHNSGYVVGFRRAWRRGASLAAVRAEAANTRITHLARVRAQGRPYEHGEWRQGHTERGQVLGSEAGQGGGALTVGYDVYGRDGRWTFELARRLVQSSIDEGAPERAWDVRYLARAERLRFGRRADLFVGAAPVVELNRNFGGDVYGVRLDAGLRFGRAPGR